jgi:hypothetical protein
MSKSISRIFTALVCLLLAGFVGFLLYHRLSEPDEYLPEETRASAQTNPGIDPTSAPQRRPYIEADTTTDSPGTNLVTRVVTFKAEIGGTPPITLQWKVDKGNGFVAVSARATNWVLVLTNALISDTGRYALFATNSAGATNTTPVPLVVVEGVD